MRLNLIHGHYETVKNLKETIAYITKLDENYLTSLDLNLSGEKKTSDQLFWEKLTKIATNENVEKAMEYFVSACPDLVGKRYNAVEKNLLKYSKTKKKILSMHFYLDSFIIPEEFKNWLKNDLHKKTLALIGNTGCGKTELVISGLISENLNPLLVRDINALKNLNSKHDAIIFDDLDCSQFSSETLIHLFDVMRDTNVRVLYDMIEIPAGTPRVLIKNKAKSIVPRTDPHYASIHRRLTIIKVAKKLFNTNVFIQNNIYFTNNITVEKDEKKE